MASTPRKITRVIRAMETSDGAGVRLKRSLGTAQLDYLDPFLLLDEFKSDDRDDYIAGFPNHPHRGFETVTYLVDGEPLIPAQTSRTTDDGFGGRNAVLEVIPETEDKDL